ncbi:protein sidekick-1-like [Lineus longissimus]|uniref:protein sidekick-1-like n=1 Tax=Lineus longissimus TaxID=88925 RepID=UPI002B4E1EF4
MQRYRIRMAGKRYHNCDHEVRMFIMIFVWCFTLSYGKIVFVAEPETTVVLLGGDFMLNCSAKETLDINQKITNKWLFNGTDLKTKFPEASFFRNNSVYMTRISKVHLGDYSCMAMVVKDGSITASATSKTAIVLSAYIEDFIISPTSVSTNDTSNAIFTCTTGKSAPPPLVYWERNGAVFLEGRETKAVFGTTGGDNSGQLSMRLEVFTDRVLDGWFACVATNPLSKERRKSSTADLRVNVLLKLPTVVVSPPSSLLAPANLPLEIRCVISGVPKPSVTWVQENGTVVPTSSRVLIADNGSLIFRPLQEIDAGNYVCRGTNGQGSVSARLTELNVAVLSMKFKKHPSNTSAISGQAVTLHCSAPYSIPLANITWYKNNNIFKPRSGEYAVTVLKTGDLYFSNIQTNDAGIYFCVVLNNFAVPRTAASISAVITVTGAPQMITPPIPTTVIKEGLLRLTCIVKGDPFPTMTWWKGNAILMASNRVSFRNLNQELWIAKMTKLDSGSYFCKANNKYGSISSQPVLVDIVVPPQILQSVESPRVPAGMSTQLHCIVFGDPVPVVVWLKDSYPLTQSAFVRVTREQVQFPKIRAEDAGTYTCRATNKGGMEESVGKVRVLVKPTFETGPSDLTVNHGVHAVLTCKGAGVPTPDIAWSYNNTKTFPPGAVFSPDKKTLTIVSAHLEHIGVYKCTLQNEVGTAEQEGKLVVQVKPTIHNITGPTVVSQTHDLTLTCVANGIPFPRITWSLNMKHLVESTDKRILFPKRNVILIKFITTADAGDYKCVAVNVLGRMEAQIRVYVRDPPRPPALQIPRPSSVNSVTLTWLPVKQETNNNVTFWVIQYRLSIAPDFSIVRSDIPVTLNSYEVSGLQSATTYHFRMAARNEVGIGQYTGVLSAKTYETAPTAPRRVKVMSQKARNVTLSWEKPSNLRTSDVTDYEVHYRRMDRIEDFVSLHVTPVLPTQTHTVLGLHPHRPYQFKVRGATRDKDAQLWGMFSETVTANTTMDLPTLPPQHLTMKVLSDTSITVSWEAIPVESQNGPISLYRVHYKQTNIPGNQETTVSAPATVVNVSNLLPWRYYTFTVAGMNPIGHSPYSEAVVARTLPGLPTGSPQDVQMVGLSSTSISVTWKAVEANKQNSAISGYILHYRDTLANKTTELMVNGSDTLSANISGLQPWTEYSIRIQAFSVQIKPGRGPLSEERKHRTKPDVPGKVRSLKVIPSAFSATVMWDAPATPNGVIENYTIVYSLISRVQVAESSTFSLTSDVNDASAPGDEVEKTSAEALTSDGTGTVREGDESAVMTEMTGPDTMATTDSVVIDGSTSTLRSPSEPSDSATTSPETSPAHVSAASVQPQSGSGSRKKRAANPATTTVDVTTKPQPTVLPPTWTISSMTSPVTLTQLEPNSIYNISVLAATSAGFGKEPVVASFTTLPTGITTTLSTTTEVAPVFLPFGIRQEHLAFFIGGCVAVATILIILIIVCVLCCVRRKRRKESPRRIFVPPAASSTGEKAPSLSDASEPPSTRNLKSLQGTKSMSKSSNVSFNPNPEVHMQQGSSSECQSSHSGGVRSNFETRPTHPVSGFSTPSCDHSRSETSLSGFNLIQNLSSVEGIENPGYQVNQADSDSDNTKYGNIPLATQHYPSGRRQEVISKRLTHQMKRRSAHVIAMQRERQSTLIAPDDIDLLANESVIVYDERTAL